MWRTRRGVTLRQAQCKLSDEMTSEVQIENIELQNIISGNEQVRFGKNIQAALTYLRTKKKTISGIKKTKFFKKQETEFLIE
jgi:hypothetical protein